MNTFTKRILLLIFVLSLLLPTSCKELLVDHPCCLPEKAEIKVAEKDLEDAEKQLNAVINVFNEDRQKLSQSMANLNNNLRFFINGPLNSGTQNLLQTFVNRYQQAKQQALVHIPFISQSISLKWAKQEALNTANIDLAACIRETCIPIDSCCPAEKITEHTALLKLELQDIKIADYDRLISLMEGLRDVAKAQRDIAQATYDAKCGSGVIVGVCIISFNVVALYKTHLADMEARVLALEKAKEDLLTERAILDLDYNLQKQLRLNCELGCPQKL